MKIKEQDIIQNSRLGKETDYFDSYKPDVLYPIPRHYGRRQLGIHLNERLPFYGFDTWNDYETSWLNSKGKPVVAMTTFHIPCSSPNIIESKSIKLYLNSLSGTQFSSNEGVVQLIEKDLSAAAKAPVTVTLHSLDSLNMMTLTKPPGICIDHLDIDVEQRYEATLDYLCTTTKMPVSEILHSNLLKSNCPVTGQPDWATLIIDYEGQKLCRSGLLRYIISLRNQHEFHEQCIERIFMNILATTNPTSLTVTGRYTRRGGKDINPCRSTNAEITMSNQRLIRQ